MNTGNHSKLLLAVLLIWVALAVVSGCRTAHGFGEDVERAGQEIQRGTE